MRARSDLLTVLTDTITTAASQGLIIAWHQPGDDLAMIRVPEGAATAEAALADLMSSAPARGLRCRWAGPRLAAIGLPTAKD